MSVELYINIYYFTLLAIVIIYAIGGETVIRNDSKMASFLLIAFVLGHITFREIDKAFADTVFYARQFDEYIKWGILELKESISNDKGFSIFTLFMAQFKSITLYFGVIALVYVLPVFFVLNKEFQSTRFIAFLLVVCSFSFWGYGVNGLRNGMATSLIIAAIFSKRLLIQIPLILIASSLHGSALLPGAVFILAKYYNKPKFYLLFYGICLLLSLLFGTQLGDLIGDWDLLNNTDERLQGYLQTEMNDEIDGRVAANIFSRVGFRWDFLLYSLVPIVLGYIYIFRLNYQNKLYRILYCTYVGCNAFWLLTIYVPFNNRFAYLSWFIYPFVISYPLLKQKDFVDFQQSKIQLMVFLNYAFTFIMFIR